MKVYCKRFEEHHPLLIVSYCSEFVLQVHELWTQVFGNNFLMALTAWSCLNISHDLSQRCHSDSWMKDDQGLDEKNLRKKKRKQSTYVCLGLVFPSNKMTAALSILSILCLFKQYVHPCHWQGTWATCVKCWERMTACLRIFW